MHSIEWTDQMNIGIESIDDQHRKLVAIYNELDEALMVGKAHKHMQEILDRLVEYTGTHFDDEEQYMQSVEYPELDYHKLEHKQLLEKVLAFQKKLQFGQERISSPVMHFLKYWLTNHILQSDMKIGAHASAPETEEAPDAATV